MKDYYAILGVRRDASQDEIKKAFRALAKQCHPDVVPEAEKKAAEERFKLVSEAYDVLGDEAKRREHDFRGNSPFRVSIDDIFGMGGRRRGADITGVLEVSLEDVVYGARRTISLRRMSGCKSCGGSGAADGRRVTCPSCGGVGVTSREFGQGAFRVSAQSVCPACGGEGATAAAPCQACSGRRHAFVNEEVVVDIPIGARDGSAMVIPGKGSWGPAGDGDLGVSIRVARHDRFQRDGDDLVTTIDLPLRTALAGGDVVVRGLRGEEVPIVVPRPCQHGQEVVVPGRGIRGGSMRVRVSFKLPSMSDEDIAKLPA